MFMKVDVSSSTVTSTNSLKRLGVVIHKQCFFQSINLPLGRITTIIVMIKLNNNNCRDKIE